MKQLIATSLPLAGLKLIQRNRLVDSRGCLSRIFCADDLRDAEWVAPIAQVNHTHTVKRGTVRGMHFQRPPHTEMKLVSCLRGEIWDVAVDVRVNSPTFLQWHAEQLSADSGRALLIPEGFAHGFQALTDDVEMLYCHSAAYNSNAEAGLNPQDAGIAIAWPLPIVDLSARDVGHPIIESGFEGVAL